MKHSRFTICTMLLFGIGLTGLQAQETNPTTGGETSGSGGTISYSVGQVVYTTNTGTDGSVAQGVQQPYEISVVSGIEQATGINIECIVYPNPVTDYLQLKIEDYQFDNLMYQLFDTDGKMIKTEKIITAQTKINTENIVQGNYLLRIVDNDKAIKTFKVIKN